MAQYDVYGVGNALVDIVVQVEDVFFDKNTIEKGVMTLIDEDRKHYLMQSIDIKKAKITAGGSGANTLISLSQLGGKGAYSFLTAQDALGKIFIDDLHYHGVDITLSYDDCPQGNSGQCLVMVSPDAERTMNTFLGVSSSLSADYVNEEMIKKATYVYLEGYLVSTPEGVETMMQAKKMALENQVLVALTLSDSNMVKFFSKNFKKIIGKRVDLLFCNENEALIYSGTNQLQQACQMLKKITRCFVVTLGAKGALLYDGDNFIEVSPHKADQVLDTNGAGDSFAGGFLYGLTHGYSYAESGKIASIVASQVVSQLGPRLSFPEQTKKILWNTNGLLRV